MTFLHYVVHVILLLNFPLKALFHYLYVREQGLTQADSVTDYLYMLPITRGPSNRYKSIANGIVLVQFLIVAGLLLIKRDQILELIKNWEKIP